MALPAGWAADGGAVGRTMPPMGPGADAQRCRVRLGCPGAVAGRSVGGARANAYSSAAPGSAPLAKRGRKGGSCRAASRLSASTLSLCEATPQ